MTKNLENSNWQKSAQGDFNKIKGGSPSAFWSSGLQRRLDMVVDTVDLKDKKILDMGCGLGEFMRKFLEYSKDVYGVEIDPDKVAIASKTFKNISVAPAEALPFEDNTFDIVFLHEVIEHVDDAYLSIKECMRVLKPTGKLINFCPNRLFPFETHGIYIGDKYYFGNIPVVTYIPFLYEKLTPHVKNFTNRQLLDLFEKSEYRFKVLKHTHVYPGFDGLSRRSKSLGSLAKSLQDFLENTPLHYFGISHFLIVEKSD